MIMHSDVESLWEIMFPQAVRQALRDDVFQYPEAQHSSVREKLRDLRQQAGIPWTVPCSRFVTHATSNLRSPFSNPIDRPANWCRVGVPDRGLTLPRRLRMAIQAHLVELERKHKLLENELHEALVHVSTDDLQIAELKRRKLMVKD